MSSVALEASVVRPESHRRRPSVLPWITAAYGLTYIGWLLAGRGSDSMRSLIANLAYLPVGFLVVLLAWQISRLQGATTSQRRGWQAIACAGILTLAGDVGWTIVENAWGLDPSESWVNLFYLGYYVALCAGLLFLSIPVTSPRGALTFFLDASVVVVSGVMLSWHYVIEPAVEAGGHSTFALLVTVGYSVGDLLALVGITSLMLRCPQGARRRPMLLLSAAIAAMLIGDLVWAHLSLGGGFTAGQLQDVFFMLQYVFFVAALTTERARMLRRDPADADWNAQPVVALPYAAVVAGYGMLLNLAIAGTGVELYEMVSGGVVLSVLVLAIALRENTRFTRERALLASEARFRSLIQHASDIVSIVDANGRIVFVSPSASTTLGYEMTTLVGASFLGLVHPEDAASTSEMLARSISGDRCDTVRWRVRKQDGEYIQTDNICTNLLRDPNVKGLVLNTRDISERCTLEEKLRHQAFHDPLTGLANRALFLDRVRHTLSRRRGHLDSLGVIFVDLDLFKTVNDSLGHAVGDELLRAAAERLGASVRVYDTIARLGGDEFAVLVDDLHGDESVHSIAERVGRAFVEPFVLGGREVISTASVGVALATAGQSAEDLLRNADLAMYLAKSRGRGQTAVFEPEMHRAMLNRLELQADLRHALDRGELHLVYQPIHSLDTQALVGVEALLRWTHPTRGVVPPSTFVPIAEETGLIVSIGNWVIRRACLDAREWREHLGDAAPKRVAVNLSGRQIPEPTLFDDVQKALADADLPPSTLVLELTESILLQHTDQTLSVMHRLKSIGVQLAIDDFGTGYSSLSYLQRLPIDILKIDRAFVERLETDPNAAELARAIIGIGKTMQLYTVAEGIENRRQADLLRSLGCDQGQGYLYGAPMHLADFDIYARQERPVTAA